MKKMISALMASLVIDEPHVGPTVVMLTLSCCVAGTPLFGAVVVVVVVAEPAAAPAAVVVVVGALVVLVVVVSCADTVGWPVRWSIAFSTLRLICCWFACDSLLRSAWTVR